MEVLVGSTYGIGKVKDQSVVSEESSDGGSRIGLRRCGRSPSEAVSESSSSEENDDVSSQERWLKSFSSSLEDSLPIKRGLSNHYIGKSKSFGNLMEARNVNDLEKVESPLNKKRRLLIANKLRRRSLSSFSNYSKINPNSMPLLALQESEEQDYKYNDDSSDDQNSKLQKKRMKMSNYREFMVKTQSCFSLTSFQDDDDDR